MCNDLAGEYRPQDWRSIGEAELWTNLVVRILSTQTRWETAQTAACQMQTAGLLDDLCARVDLPKSEICNFLLVHRPTVRWPARKAGQIWEASRRLYHTKPKLTLGAILESADSASSARRTLLETIPGIGMKQASHFLQSIGFSPSMAILDRHVERFMGKRCGYVKYGRTYEEKEAVFQALAAQTNVPAAVLDFAIWTFMRA